MLYALLGIIQGLTEFLPVSSSGHLVLFTWLSGVKQSQVLPIIITCHLGTFFALICFFARDIWAMFKDLAIVAQIVVVNLITAIIVLSGRGFFEQLFQRPRVVCLALLVTAIILISARRFSSARRDMFALNFKDAFWLGLSQGLAVIPGISRSGITIFSLLARGVKPETAFKFSFIAGIPAILGSFLIELKDIKFAFNNHLGNLCLALGMSFFFGLLGLFILKRVVKRLQLHYFGYYLIMVSILGFIFVK